MIAHAHDSIIILASIVVSLVAAFTGLALTSKIGTLPVSRQKSLIVMSAFVLGGGIWSMHFVAMLAHRFDVPIHYDLLQTLSSALVAILVVGLALLILHFAERTPRVLTGAGLLLGTGIVSMHLIGMLGMRGVIPVFSLWSLMAATAVAAIMGVMAIRVSYGTRTPKSVVLGGLLFGFSVVFVHFTAMAGTHFLLDPAYQPVNMALDSASLAIAVTVSAFVICGTFLLAASTFLTRQAALAAPIQVAGHEGSTDPAQEGARTPEAVNGLDASIITPGLSQEPGCAATFNGEPFEGLSDVLQGERLDAGQGRVPSSVTEHGVAVSAQGTDSTFSVAVTADDTASLTAQLEPLGHDGDDKFGGSLRIPFERNKHIEFVFSSEVGAVRADGRYTHLYTPDGVRFCPWSIAEAEKRLAAEPFYRSHRSYLINLQRVAAFEKNRDAGQCRFDGFPQLSNVPVSRARVGKLLQHLGL